VALQWKGDRFNKQGRYFKVKRINSIRICNKPIFIFNLCYQIAIEKKNSTNIFMLVTIAESIDSIGMLTRVEDKFPSKVSKCNLLLDAFDC